MTFPTSPPPPPSTPPSAAAKVPAVVPESLDQFVFSPDQFLKDAVPRDLLPVQVELLVRTKINLLTPPRALEQLLKVVDYYDVYEVAPHLVKLLTRNEKNADELLRSAILARIIALIGLPEEVAFAKDYYDYLVGRADYQLFGQLILLYEMLGPAADSKALAAKMDARVKVLARDKDKDDASRAAYNSAERLLNFSLNRATRAAELKRKTLDIKDRPARIADEIKTYLAMQYGFGEYLPLFAARRLKRETWAEQPEQQVKRTIDPKLREQVVQTLRATLPAIKALKLTDEEKTFMTIADLDAVNFFGGVLDKAETELLAGPGAMQKNILTVRKFN